jgi:hypothetical protein
VKLNPLSRGLLILVTLVPLGLLGLYTFRIASQSVQALLQANNFSTAIVLPFAVLVVLVGLGLTSRRNRRLNRQLDFRNQQLEQSEERLRLAQEAASIGAWDYDLVTGDFTGSSSLEPLLGLAPGTFAGTREAFFECIHQEDRPLLAQAVKRAAEDGA